MDITLSWERKINYAAIGQTFAFLALVIGSGKGAN